MIDERVRCTCGWEGNGWNAAAWHVIGTDGVHTVTAAPHVEQPTLPTIPVFEP